MNLTKAALLSIMFVMSTACASGQTVIRDTTNIPVSLLRVSNPPAIYEDWWRSISDCSHVDLPPDHAESTTWVIVPARPFRSTINGVNDDGLILTDDTRNVVIFINYTGLLDRGLITHEMEHALLFWKFGRKYVGQHPLPYYSQCGLVEKGQQKR